MMDPTYFDYEIARQEKELALEYSKVIDVRIKLNFLNKNIEKMEESHFRATNKDYEFFDSLEEYDGFAQYLTSLEKEIKIAKKLKFLLEEEYQEVKNAFSEKLKNSWFFFCFII